MITSTSEVYGEARYFPIDEEHPVKARSPYAATKISADQLAVSYHAAFGLPLKIVRPFNIFGPRQSARAIIPTVIAQILDGAETLHLGNVHPTRDWTYVQDVVTAFEKIAETAESIGQVIHIGSGGEISISRLVELTARLMGREVRIVADLARTRPSTSEVSRLLCDSAKLRKLTGWNPSFSLEQGLKQTIDWIRACPAMHSANRYVV